MENVDVVGKEEEDKGLKLVVRGSVVEDMVFVVEIDMRRLDMYWGMFRVLMKMMKERGICLVFFWVRKY